MCQAVTFNLSHGAAAAGPGFSSYFCFDWGLIVTGLELGVHSKKGETLFHRERRPPIMCLQLAVVEVWIERTSLSMGAGAIALTDLLTPNHMSHLILVSRLN